MSTIDESVLAKTPLGSDLAAGVDSLSLDQEITFTRYQRLVLPLDGYVFWVKADMVGPSALYNKAQFGRAGFNYAPKTTVAAPTLTVKGSLHYATDTRQEQEENYAASRVVFTAESEVQDLNAIEPGTIWIGEFDGRRFAFSSLGSFYKQADLFHYVGMAIYADMEPQIIDSLAGFDSTSVVVSNSLPAWLAMSMFAPVYGFGPVPPLFPSFLTPLNEPPPFASIHIPPEGTRGLAMAPTISSADSSHTQLCSDIVRITLWGSRNYTAMDFLDQINLFSVNTDLIGMMGTIPVWRDEKRTQSELGTIAMKKTIEFEVSYLQRSMRDIAVKVIKSCVPNISIGGVD